MKSLFIFFLGVSLTCCRTEFGDNSVKNIDLIVSEIEMTSNLIMERIGGIATCDGAIGVLHEDYYISNPRELLKTSDIEIGDPLITTSFYFYKDSLIYVRVTKLNQVLQKIYIKDGIIIHTLNDNYKIEGFLETARYYLDTFKNVQLDD